MTIIQKSDNLEVFNLSKEENENTIFLEITLLTLCNLHCSYCFARKGEWNKILRTDILENTINMVENYKGYTFAISLFGGEPTLHSELNNIIERFSKIEHVKTVAYFSNNSTDRILNVVANDKTLALITYHAEQIKNDEEFVQRVKTIASRNSIKLSVVLEFKYDERIKTMFNIFKDIKNVFLQPIFLFNPSTFKFDDAEYTSTFFEQYSFFNEIEPCLEIDDKRITYFSAIQNNVHRLKGINCFQNTYSMDFNGNIFRNCDKKHCGNVKNTVHFPNEYLVCLLDTCNCGNLLTNYKETI